MSDIETRLQSLKDRQQEAARRYAQAEARLDTVRARRDELMDALKEHGFDTPSQAREKVNELSGEVEQILEKISEEVSGL